MKPCLISVPTYNRLSFTKRCIQSILDHTDESLYDLAIVDDFSDDGTREWLRKLKKEHPEIIITLFNEWIPGVVKSINFNLLKKQPEQFFISMDNDTCFTSSDWLYKVFDMFHKDSTIGAIALKPAKVDEQGQVFPKHPFLSLELTHGIPNSCTITSPIALNDVGFYFDDYPWCGFDYDWALRIIKCGYYTGYYSSSRTNPDDFIDIIDLGRDLNEEYGGYKVEQKYSYEMWAKLQIMNKESMDIINDRFPKINTGEVPAWEDTKMKEFKNFETL